MSQDELSDHARSVIDSNRYMALGTADEAGHPWVSPVWFASEDHRSFHLGLLARFEALTEPRHPPGGRHRDL
jgi:nitroimidazol reductase NimA-like FMN-containing flavoprotein (pyridoxamine 5'-phosphate oxidase superfamily)